MIRSKAIQATYDLPASGNLDMALVYGFAQKRASIKVYCNDLLEISSIDPRIDFGHQHLRMVFASYREFGITFTYRFGGYKEKQRQGVDDARFK
ncbi:MAG TPA: hypothetical protein VIQ97_02160 [Prevotella sp.]